MKFHKHLICDLIIKTFGDGLGCCKCWGHQCVQKKNHMRTEAYTLYASFISLIGALSFSWDGWGQVFIYLCVGFLIVGLFCSFTNE